MSFEIATDQTADRASFGRQSKMIAIQMGIFLYKIYVMLKIFLNFVCFFSNSD